jgi:hypothetical protein
MHVAVVSHMGKFCRNAGFAPPLLRHNCTINYVAELDEVHAVLLNQLGPVIDQYVVLGREGI